MPVTAMPPTSPSDSETDRLEHLLEGILGPGEADLEVVPPAGQPLLGPGPPEAAAAAGDGKELSQEEVAALIDQDQAAGQRLARRGDCVLLVSTDRMTASFWGQMPEGTTFKDVRQLLEETGISYGVIQSRIYEVLPQRRSSRRREDRSRGPSRPTRRETVVAEGRLPKPPGTTRTEYAFQVIEESEAERLQRLLDAGPVTDLRAWSQPVPLVEPGQHLADLACQPGEDGCDIFGQAVPAPLPPPGSLGLGAQVTAADDGQSCAAAALGYAVVTGDAISVLSPIWVAPDLVHAYFVLLPQPGPLPRLRPGAIRQALTQAGVVHGIIDEELTELGDRIARDPRQVELLTLVARGTDAFPGHDARWRLCGDPVLAEQAAKVHRRLTRSPDLETLSRQVEGLVAQAVSKDQELAVKEPAVPGRPGRDLFGEEFLPEEPKDALVEAGEQVELSPDGLSCRAGLFGYLGATRRLQQLFVVSPVWVARDRMAACYLHLQPAGKPQVPSDKEIDQLLDLAGVRFGVDHRAVGVLLERLRQGLPVSAVVTLATGSPPVPGQDGRFEFTVDRQRQPGFIRSDGSIDFKQLALAPIVEPGQLVGTRHPAKPGRDGMDVLGRALTARPGQEVTVDLGGSIRLLRQDDQPDEYRAEIEGELVIVERTDRSAPVIHLAVHQVLSVPGDVDYRTGNLDFPGSVHVTGTIRSGFTVKAGGNLIVGDSIEDGVVAEAGGNLVVAHGISGGRTRITTGGAVFAKFISEARVRARGDLNVAEYLLRAAVRADGELVAWGTTGRRSSGLIAGGMVMAGKAIRAAEVGTEASGPTQLVAGVDSALLGELARLQTIIDQHQEALNKILRSLQAERLEAAQLRQLLLNLVLRATGERRKMLARAVRNLLAVQAQLQELTGQRHRLEADLEELAAQAEVRVSGRIAPNTVLKIGTQVHRVGTEGGQVVGTRFALGPARNGRRQIQLSTA